MKNTMKMINSYLSSFINKKFLYCCLDSEKDLIHEFQILSNELLNNISDEKFKKYAMKKTKKFSKNLLKLRDTYYKEGFWDAIDVLYSKQK